MPLPQLGDVQIEWVSQHVADYIEGHHQTFAARGIPLNQNQKTTMEAFFSESTLDSARIVVLASERVNNPPFYGELIRMGFEAGFLPDFAHMAAITFVDTVVSHGSYDDRLLFHELVHVVQYEKLGLAEFAAKYVRGFLRGGSYEAIPLEINAYELDARFAAAAAKPFSVEAEVEAWIRADRF